MLIPARTDVDGLPFIFRHGPARPLRRQLKAFDGDDLPICHGRAWPGHPRLWLGRHKKSWVAWPSPAMTERIKPRPVEKYCFSAIYIDANAACSGYRSRHRQGIGGPDQPGHYDGRREPPSMWTATGPSKQTSLCCSLATASSASSSCSWPLSGSSRDGGCRNNSS